MMLPEIFNLNKEMEEVWKDFKNEYGADIDSFRYGESEFTPENFDSIVQFINNGKSKKEIVVSYLLGQLYLANKVL